MPAAAEAGTASFIDAGSNFVAGYTAADGEVNNVRVTVADNKLVFADSRRSRRATAARSTPRVTRNARSVPTR